MPPDKYLFARHNPPPKLEPPGEYRAKLPPSVERVLHAMVHGVDKTLYPAAAPEERIPPGMPLSASQAAFAVGFSLKRLQFWSEQSIFRERLRVLLEDRRNEEEPSNLRVAIQLRDNVGDGSAMRDSIRLKAIASIRSKDTPPATAVNVAVTQTNNTTAQANVVSPGYVIKLDGEK